MKITWLGHSCFKIETKNECIILDPYKDGYVDGLKPIREQANLVLCSHEHADHNARETIEIKEKEITSKISSISTYHDDKQGTLRGLNTIYIIDDGQYKVAHLGDLGCELSEEQIRILKQVDVLLIPVGGTFTIDSKQASALVSSIDPKCVIPMHYQGKNFGYPVLESVDHFTQYFDDVCVLNTNTVDVSSLHHKIVVLTLN